MVSIDRPNYPPISPPIPDVATQGVSHAPKTASSPDGAVVTHLPPDSGIHPVGSSLPTLPPPTVTGTSAYQDRPRTPQDLAAAVVIPHPSLNAVMAFPERLTEVQATGRVSALFQWSTAAEPPDGIPLTAGLLVQALDRVIPDSIAPQVNALGAQYADRFAQLGMERGLAVELGQTTAQMTAALATATVMTLSALQGGAMDAAMVEQILASLMPPIPGDVTADPAATDPDPLRQAMEALMAPLLQQLAAFQSQLLALAPPINASEFTTKVRV